MRSNGTTAYFIYRQKFAEDEAEQKKREQFIEKKKKLNELMHERIERQKAIRDTFKGIIMDGEGFKSGIQDQGQGILHFNLC